MSHPIPSQHREAELQLSSAVQSQVNDLRFSIDLIKSSSRTIGSMQNYFATIFNHCEECQKLLQHFDGIREINLARKNLSNTIRWLRNFRSIPEKAGQLLQLLVVDETKIKSVYKDLRQLSRLREIRAKETKHAGRYHLSASQQMETNMAKLGEVVKAVLGVLWGNIKDAVLLAQDSPATLIRTLEVIEMEDRAKLKIFQEHHDVPDKAMHDRALEILDQCISERFVDPELFHETEAKELRDAAKILDEAAKQRALVAPNPDEDDEDANTRIVVNREQRKVITRRHEQLLDSILLAFDEIVDDLRIIRFSMAKCFPPSYDIFSFHAKRYEIYLHAQLLFQVSDVRTFSMKSLLTVARWIQSYFDTLYELAPHTSPTHEFDDVIDLVMEEFVHQTKDRIETLVRNILDQDAERPPQCNRDGHYFTFGIMDTFKVMNQTIDLATKEFNLRGRALKHVVDMLVEQLNIFHKQQASLLHAARVENGELLMGDTRKDDVYVIALCNNCFRADEMIQSIQDHTVMRLTYVDRSRVLSRDAVGPSDDETRMIDEADGAFERVINGFTDTAGDAIDVLVKLIMSTVAEPVEGLYSPNWLHDTTITKMISVTLSDFFSDYENSLTSPAYLTQLLGVVLQHIAQAYLDQLLVVKPKVTGSFQTRLEEDQKLLTMCFLPFSQYIPESQIEEKMSALDAIRKLMAADIGFLQSCFKPFYTAFRAESTDVLDALLRVRNADRRDRLATIEAFQTFLLEKASSHGHAGSSGFGLSRGGGGRDDNRSNVDSNSSGLMNKLLGRFRGNNKRSDQSAAGDT
jgi:Exocyst complex component Sec6